MEKVELKTIPDLYQASLRPRPSNLGQQNSREVRQGQKKQRSATHCDCEQSWRFKLRKVVTKGLFEQVMGPTF